MGQPTLEFSGEIGEKSIGLGGPDVLKEDLEELSKMFDPDATLKSGLPGGISPANMQEGSIDDASIGDLTPNEAISSSFSGTGKLSVVLSFLAKLVKAITGKANWYTLPVTSVEGLNTRMGAAEGNISSTASTLSTHRASSGADHDTRYYRKTQLEGNGQAAVHWNNLTNVPPWGEGEVMSVKNKFFTTTAGQTVFSVADVGSYVPGTYTLSVYREMLTGVYMLIDPANSTLGYTETNSTAVTMNQPIEAGRKYWFSWFENAPGVINIFNEEINEALDPVNDEITNLKYRSYMGV